MMENSRQSGQPAVLRTYTTINTMLWLQATVSLKVLQFWGKVLSINRQLLASHLAT